MSQTDGGEDDEIYAPRDSVGKVSPLLPTLSPTLDDLVGLSRELADEVLLNIGGEAVFKSLGVQGDSTYLLTGHPGTGKTMAVSALNNHLNREAFKNKVVDEDAGKIAFTLSHPFFDYSVGKYGTAYINQSSRKVQAVFDVAQKCAQRGINAFVVIDEADSLLGSRRGSIQSHSEDRKVLETIMTNLQSAHDQDHLYVFLMTNTPEDCDEASLRAGRIDRRYVFNLPNPKERGIAIERFIGVINERAGYQVVRNYTVDNLVELSEGFNYADLNSVVEGAVKDRAREILKDRENKVIPAGYVTGKRLEERFKKHKESYHPKTQLGFQ
jgi:SpoVK/Ycf46/Vps4 family AAA+-type ATPase